MEAWPASELTVVERVPRRVFGSDAAQRSKIAPNTIQSYLSVLKSYHVDHHLPIQAFTSPRIDRILNGARSLYPHSKKERLPIIKDILVKITLEVQISTDEINVKTTFKVAWAGFLWISEFTSTSAEAKADTIVDTKLTRSDVMISEKDQHAILGLKRSKKHLDRAGVEIIGQQHTIRLVHLLHCACCSLRIRSLAQLPFFRFTGRSTAFAGTPVLEILQKRLQLSSINMPKSYTGHSFRKGAAQHASDNASDNLIRTNLYFESKRLGIISASYASSICLPTLNSLLPAVANRDYTINLCGWYCWGSYIASGFCFSLYQIRMS